MDPLTEDKPLNSFGQFSRAVPDSWRKAPVYIRDHYNNVKRARALILDHDASGRKIIVLAYTSTEAKT